MFTGSSETVPVTQQGTSVESTESVENCIPDEDEIFNVNIPETDKEISYVCEDDDEVEEQLRSVHLDEAGPSTKSFNMPKNPKKSSKT